MNLNCVPGIFIVGNFIIEFQLFFFCSVCLSCAETVEAEAAGATSAQGPKDWRTWGLLDLKLDFRVFRVLFQFGSVFGFGVCSEFGLPLFGSLFLCVFGCNYGRSWVDSTRLDSCYHRLKDWLTDWLPFPLTRLYNSLALLIKSYTKSQRTAAATRILCSLLLVATNVVVVVVVVCNLTLLAAETRHEFKLSYL